MNIESYGEVAQKAFYEDDTDEAWEITAQAVIKEFCERNGEATAWLYTMEYETGECHYEVTLEKESPFGIPGKDFSEEFKITKEPLFLAPPSIGVNEPVAHMFPSDIERFKKEETFAQVYSVAVGNPEEKSVPVFLAVPPMVLPSVEEIAEYVYKRMTGGYELKDASEFSKDTAYAEAQAVLELLKEKNKNG